MENPDPKKFEKSVIDEALNISRTYLAKIVKK